MQEIFKDIPGYEGLYQVSNFGIIKALSKYIKNKHGGYSLRKEKILKQFQDKDGYLYVKLSINGNKKHNLVHRLVAITFILNPENKKIINHKNSIRKDNRTENIEWCTQSENILHKYRKGNLGGEIARKAVKERLSIQVNQYTKKGEFIKQWYSIMDIERALGIKNTDISICCKGRRNRKTAGGFTWKYA